MPWPPLPLTLLKGALLSPFKRPGTGRSDAPGLRARARAAPGRVEPYRRVCGFAPTGDTVPLPYPHVLAFPLTTRLLAARAFPLPLLGLVHTSIEVVQHRAPRLTDELDLTAYVAGLAPHHRGTQATLAVAAAVGGAVVWESRSTYLARHRTGTTAAPRRSRGDEPPLPARAEWRLAADLGRRYAAVSGDRNPIHLHPLTARPFGFPRAIAHGMWTFARCLAEYGPAGTEPVRVTAEFRAPVPLPSTVTYGCQGQDFELRDSTGRPHLRGRVEPLAGR
ncbi:MaoC/PaaZ C-terminal domain-containing protein [Streptomyces sp. NRRL B-1347]|uniref:MaoC/PaaZ C-terminal domain-containing protein n=1 Tax=Streptomyces sp. NRRL B-1347 TaxID=1476877 RepID=UPI0004CB4D6E|nr:MaoC/PaaZ C-terminal domain-containing protein [Streptomyces sp. NRRL B-1347]